jgi:hypothetical protein
MTKAVIDDKIAHRPGRIANTASVVGRAGVLPLFSHYKASKSRKTSDTPSRFLPPIIHATLLAKRSM